MADIIQKLNPLGLTIIIFIIVIFIASAASIFLIGRKYRKMRQVLNLMKKGENVGEKYKVLDAIVEDYRGAAKESLDEINTQAIIEKHFNNELRSLFLGERFVKTSVSLMIILGLLGTFYGLTLSIGKLVELLGNSGNADVLSSVDSIVEGLIDSVRGMSVAFVTSLFGIASSIVITIINIVYNIEDIRESLMVDIEEYLDNKIALEFNKNIEDKYTLITETLKDSFNQFGERIEDSFKYVINSSSQNLAAAAKEMETSSNSLLNTVQMFDKTMDKFTENTRDFSEFNHELRTNIQRMNVMFSDFTKDLREIIKEMSQVERG